MTFSRRDFLLAAGALSLAATATACGTNTGRGGSTAATNTISAWFHEYGEDGVHAALKQDAAAFTKASVEIKWNPGEYAKLLNSALLTDQGPDVFEVEMGASLDMIKAGQVVDLTDVMGSSSSQFMHQLIERFSYQGKLYAIPQAVDMQLLYYRKSAFDKAGVKPPTTFNELVEAANKVKTSSMGGFFAGNDGGLGVLGAMLIYASGNRQLNADKTDIGFANDAFYEALSAFTAFSRSDAMLKAASADWFKTTAFETGETAMQWGGLWSMTDVQKALGDDFGVVAFPAIGSAGKQAVPFGAFGSCISAKSTNIDAAKDFVKWLWIEQTDRQVEFANNFGTHVPSQPALASRCTKLASGPGATAAKLLADQGVAASDLMWTSAMADTYTAALTNIVVKGADAKTEIAAVSAKAKAELKRLR
ncbi:MAG: ABC transporter substrate-binding protein [Propionibacteriaceae bacterium]